MNNAAFPFANVDMTKVMADFDPAKIVGQFAKAAGTYQIPQLDVDALVAAQQKNIEALTAANKAAAEGVQALATRQNEILQETMKEVTDAVNALTKVDGPEEAAAKQADIIKVSFEKTLGNMKELAEMVAKSNADTSNAINARVFESLDEIKKQAVKVKKQAK